MDCRAYATPKGLWPRRRVKPDNDNYLLIFNALLVILVLDTRVSGLNFAVLQDELILTFGLSGFGLQKSVDALSVHEVCADETGEGERRFDVFLVGSGELQQ